MANHIPTGFSPEATTGNTNKDFPPPHIFDDGATVNFRVHKVEATTRARKFNAGTPQELILDDCELWSFQIILSDPADSSLSNMTFLDIVKDGRAWNVLSVKGSPWVQQKFLNMCTGFGLRKSKEAVNLNPDWFTNAENYTMVTGQCKVDKENYQGKYRNKISWFVESAEPAQPMSSLLNTEGGASVDTFEDDQAIPF